MNYCMSGKKKTVSLILIGLLVILMGRMFYGSFKAGIIILPLVIPIYRQYSTKYKDRAKAEFEHQYKEMLVALKDGIVTGYSVENGLKESYREMVNIYGYDGLICSELRLMTSRLKLNTPIEIVFKDFAERTDLESAHMFYNTFSIAQKSGGNMNNVIKRVIENIVLKESVKEEINVAINDKKLYYDCDSVVFNRIYKYGFPRFSGYNVQIHNGKYSYDGMSNSLSACILVERKNSKGKHIRLQKLCKYRIRSFDTVNTVIKRGG